MVRISLRLPEHLHEQLVQRASADRRSLNSEILYLLETALGPGGGADRPGGGSAFPDPLRRGPDSSPG